jgi:hypothetical protein
MTGVASHAPFPYPTISSDGALRPGFLRQHPRACIRCTERPCRSMLVKPASSPIAHATCPYGYGAVLMQTSGAPMLVNGIYVPGMTEIRLPKILRRKCKVAWEPLRRLQHMLAVTPAAAVSDPRTATAASPPAALAGAPEGSDLKQSIHDIKTVANLVVRSAERYVRNIENRDLNDDLADPDLMRLAKAVGLLVKQFDLINLVSNPASASHGPRHPTPVFKVCHKIVRLFRPQAEAKHVHLEMTGVSHSLPSLYDSFETLPLVLMDNAVKYSHDRTKIVFSVNDVSDGCEIYVESTGRMVPESCVPHIFEKAYRGKNALHEGKQGSGVGLYLAKLVADALGASIQYRAEPVMAVSAVGRNIFTVHIPASGGR